MKVYDATKTKVWLVAAAFCVIFIPVKSYAITVTTTGDANTLASTILGSGISLVGSATYTGAAVASGTFTGGLASGIGIDSGILLTSGNAQLAVGPNNSSGATGNNGLAGSSLLDP